MMFSVVVLPTPEGPNSTQISVPTCKRTASRNSGSCRSTFITKRGVLADEAFGNSDIQLISCP